MANQAADTFKALVFAPLVDALIAGISLPPFTGVIGLIIRYVAGLVFEKLALLVNFEVILLKNEAAQTAFAAASIDLKHIAGTSGISSPAFLEARDAHKLALSKLIRFTGT